VRANAGVPLILDESVWSPETTFELIRAEACDRIVLKLNRVGGFYPAQQIVAMCSAAGVGVSVDTNPYNLVGDTASCHIAATIPDHYPVDCEGHVTFLDIGDRSVFQGGVGFKDGRAELQDVPGLGVTVDWVKLEKLSRNR
jgi:L-alanine-DL-glutamate epimerase-like enolase superfamily enzyme